MYEVTLNMKGCRNWDLILKGHQLWVLWNLKAVH